MTTTTERKLARTHAEQIKLAKEELKIEKQWQKDGGKEPKPELPNLDAVLARIDARSQQRSSTSGTSTPRVPKMTGLRFFHDDKPQPDNQNKLSTMAYDYTRKVDGDTPRVSTARLREILAGLGVADTTQPFKATLPNGIVLELRSESVSTSTSNGSSKPVDAFDSDRDPATGKRPSEIVMEQVERERIERERDELKGGEHNDPRDPELEARTAAKAQNATKRTRQPQTQAQKDERNAKRRAARAAK